MAIKDTHGVVIAYYGVEQDGPPAFHSPKGCRWGPEAMKSDAWELFPSFEVAFEGNVAPCNVCFYGEKQQPR